MIWFKRKESPACRRSRDASRRRRKEGVLKERTVVAAATKETFPFCPTSPAGQPVAATSASLTKSLGLEGRGDTDPSA